MPRGINVMKRYLPLDILRGITIFGMILTAIAPYGVLPAWMYHIQNPPPMHQLDMSISGLSWVDLVFPIFLFCMGVAIPLAGRRKEVGNYKYVLSSFERFFMLWIFSYLYVFLDFSSINNIWAQIATMGGFAALFPLYLVIKNQPQNKVRAIRVVGIILIAALIIIGHCCFGEVISLQRRGIIIFLLAFIYLFASLIWYFTKNRPVLRGVILAVILLFTIVTQYYNLPSIAYSNPNIRWWFNFEYIYFLLLVIPATFVGDIIYFYKMALKDEEKVGKLVRWVSFFVILFFIIYCLIAFYYNNEPIKMTRKLLPFIAAIVFTFLLFALKAKTHNTIVIISFIMFFMGIMIEMFDGGIKKVPCTISYCFITGSITALMLVMIDLLNIKNSSTCFLSGAGENPLMSYIAFSNFILPLMNATGLIHLYKACYPIGMPWIGTLRAFIAVAITLYLVALLSRRKIYWKA